METRLQQINDDTVLEITETKDVKTRYSEKQLLSQRSYFEEMLLKAQAGLDKVNDLLAQIHNEKSK